MGPETLHFSPAPGEASRPGTTFCAAWRQTRLEHQRYHHPQVTRWSVQGEAPHLSAVLSHTKGPRCLGELPHESFNQNSVRRKKALGWHWPHSSSSRAQEEQSPLSAMPGERGGPWIPLCQGKIGGCEMRGGNLTFNHTTMLASGSWPGAQSLAGRDQHLKELTT